MNQSAPQNAASPEIELKLARRPIWLGLTPVYCRFCRTELGRRQIYAAAGPGHGKLLCWSARGLGKLLRR